MNARCLGTNMLSPVATTCGFRAQALPELEHCYSQALLAVERFRGGTASVKASRSRKRRSWLASHFSAGCRVWLFRVMANAIMRESGASFDQSAQACGNGDPADNAQLSGREIQESAVSVQGKSHFHSCPTYSKEALWELPDKYRLMVLLYVVEGFSCREISSITGFHTEDVTDRLRLGGELLSENHNLEWQQAQPAAHSQPQLESVTAKMSIDQRASRHGG